ncbi:MAG TPA: hypothetical protein VGJ13_10270 [Pseudonocardiaceae bacterium]|jgi:hypothetical protein
MALVHHRYQVVIDCFQYDGEREQIITDVVENRAQISTFLTIATATSRGLRVPAEGNRPTTM